MSNQEELQDIQVAVEEQEQEETVVELSDEARVAFALYLDVMKNGKVTPAGTKVPALNVHKLARVSEVNNKQVSKSFDRLRTKGFLANDPNGELIIPDVFLFEQWLEQEGAAIY